MAYTLNFQNQWEPAQLIRRGGERDPLERELRTVRVDQYENALLQRERRRRRVYDFLVNMDGYIIPSLSSGKGDTIHSIRPLPTFVDEVIAENVGINV